MGNNVECKVCVRCMTYNHAPYIKDALDGFCSQQTGFPFVCTIVDDASSDGEQGVIINYLKDSFNLPPDFEEIAEQTDDYTFYFAQHKTNENCFFAVYLLKYNHYRKKSKEQYISKWMDSAKYIAMCEGDDFWVDSYKLQKQVDFLEGHPDYGMCHTDFNLSHGRRRHFKVEPDEDGVWFPRILTDGMGVGTCTVMLRRSVFDRTPKLKVGKGWLMGDYPMWIEMAHEAKVKYLPVVTAKYRVLNNSASHSTDINKLIAFKKNRVEIWKFYCRYYDIKTKKDDYGPDFYESIVRFACRLGEKEIAQEYYNKAKVESKVSHKCHLFYLASRYSIVKYLIQLYIKI